MAQTVELHEKWEQQVDHQLCTHRNQEVERGDDGVVTATYHCLTCGKAVFRIYREDLPKLPRR